MNYPKGSEWRKWDLHIHSAATLLNNQFAGRTPDEKWGKYVAQLESIQDVCALGIAAQNRVDILLTWNCRHLANPHLLAKLRIFMAARGLVLPEVCTPIEIVGE